MEPGAPLLARRAHVSRLMKIWRSAGWPQHDPVELELLAAGWVERCTDPNGRETLRLSDAGVLWLATERQRNQRALSPHDRLAERMAQHLMNTGRVVWRELSLRARFDGDADAQDAPLLRAAEGPSPLSLWPPDTETDAEPARGAEGGRKARWRLARPDVFSVRHTSVEAYLQPVVHEVKVSRADLLSDLRHAAKRQSYQWLCCECYYVYPAGLARPEEIPEAFGVWVVHGDIEHGPLELLRPAAHVPCALPFSVWMALAKSSPLRADPDAAQGLLGAPDHETDAA